MGGTGQHEGEFKAPDLEGQRSGASAVAFCADGRRLLTTGECGQVYVWSVATRRLLAVLPAFEELAGPTSSGSGVTVDG